MQAPIRRTQTSIQQRFDRPPSSCSDPFSNLFAQGPAPSHLIQLATIDDNTAREPAQEPIRSASPKHTPASVWYSDTRVAALAAEGTFERPGSACQAEDVESPSYSPSPAVSPAPEVIDPARMEFLDMVTEQDDLLMESGRRGVMDSRKEGGIEEMMRGRRITDLFAAVERK